MYAVSTSLRLSCSLPGAGDDWLWVSWPCVLQNVPSLPWADAVPKATEAAEPPSVCPNRRPALDVTCTVISDPPVGEMARKLTPVSLNLRHFGSQRGTCEKPPPWFPASFRLSCPPRRILFLKPIQLLCGPRASHHPRFPPSGLRSDPDTPSVSLFLANWTACFPGDSRPPCTLLLEPAPLLPGSPFLQSPLCAAHPFPVCPPVTGAGMEVPVRVPQIPAGLTRFVLIKITEWPNSIFDT